jgi:hypothetical protein
MSKSIAEMADEIMAGDLTDPSTPTAFNSPLKRENELPQITDAHRDSLLAESMGSCMMSEKLGPELKKHATQGTTSYSPASSERDTKVTLSKDDEANLSPKAKSKLKSHRDRKSAKSDERTSGMVDRQQPHQKRAWQAERERQKAHSDSRNQSTRGAKPEAGTTAVSHIGGGPVKNSDPRTMATRQHKLTPANKAKVAANDAGHRVTRRANMKAADAASDEASRKEMREKGAARRRAAGIKKRELSTEQLGILHQAREIMREVTAAGGIGTGSSQPGQRSTFTQNNQGKPMGKDMVPIAPVDKSLSKTSKKLTPKAKKKAKRKVKTESLDLFLGRIITESQQQC